MLAALTGDAVPDYGSSEMRDFQVRMLKRQIDLMLLKQAAMAKGIARPDEPVETLIADFVTRVGGSDARLQQLMAENGVAQADLARWFEDSTLGNMFVAQELLQDRDPSEREAATQEWLTKEWAARGEEILVNFYDPDTLGAPDAAVTAEIPIEVVQPGGAATAAPATTAP